MSDDPTKEITHLLAAWSEGDPEALDRLAPLVHDRLRRLAASYLQGERKDHTLQTAALVNEAFLRLVQQEKVRWRGRAHFFALAARMMRRILVDHARSHAYVKRGGRAIKAPVEALEHVALERHPDVVSLEDALGELARRDRALARLVELRYFGGLTKEELAEVLGISRATVTRRWQTARAWLYCYLETGEAHEL